MANPAIDKAARYSARSIILAGEQQRELACAAIRNAPNGVECLLREPVKIRKPDANKAMWAGPLKDIAKQAWYKGAQFSDVVWHDTYKRLFLRFTLNRYTRTGLRWESSSVRHQMRGGDEQ